MSDVATNGPQGHDYTGPERRSRPRRASSSTHGSLRRLRLFYFYLAALWGFAVGAAGFAIALALLGRPAGFDAMVVLALVPFAGFAVLGGAVASIAYREARRQRR